MTYETEMERALRMDGEKLAALTGEDHGPWDMDPGEWDGVFLHFIPEEPAEVAELREQLATALADAARWKANHAEMVQRNAVLRERPDLPADRLPSIARYEAQLAAMRKALQAYQDIAPTVMTALMATRGRDDLLLAHAVHQLTYPARAALAPQVQP